MEIDFKQLYVRWRRILETKVQIPQHHRYAGVTGIEIHMHLMPWPMPREYNVFGVKYLKEFGLCKVYTSLYR